MMEGDITLKQLARTGKSIFKVKSARKISVMNQREQAGRDRGKEPPKSAAEIVEEMREGLDGFSPEAPPKLFSEDEEVVEE